MTKDKALKLALEALECVLDDSPKVLDASISGGLYEVVQCRDAITAINEALAQPERQPLTSHPSSVHPLRRGDILRCIETDELCTVWATSTTGKTLVKWSANNFGDYTAEQIGELFWIEPEPVQEHHGCACRWNDEGDRTVTCERHQGWLEVIAEWADRAREAEAKLKAIPPAAQRARGRRPPH